MTVKVLVARAHTGVNFQKGDHLNSLRVCGGLEEVEQHPLDGDRRVVLRRRQPVPQLDELQDLVERAAAVGRYDEVDSLEGRNRKNESFGSNQHDGDLFIERKIYRGKIS